jgi:hypothetical protein
MIQCLLNDRHIVLGQTEIQCQKQNVGFVGLPLTFFGNFSKSLFSSVLNFTNFLEVVFKVQKKAFEVQKSGF